MTRELGRMRGPASSEEVRPSRPSELGMRIENESRHLCGTPWRHQGRTPGGEGGTDCIGALLVAGRRAGAYVRDFRAYRKTPSPRELLTMIAQVLDPVACAKDDCPDYLIGHLEKVGARLETSREECASHAVRGDVVVLFTRRGRKVYGPHHVGTRSSYGGEPYLIHGEERSSSVCEVPFTSPYGPSETHSVWRFRHDSQGAPPWQP